MNTANLQLEGLLMAVAALNRLLAEKGLVSRGEIETALRRAEAHIDSGERLSDDIRPANRDAMRFPIRLLLLANSGGEFESAGFSELAREVGLTKQPYNDQR